MTFDESSKGSSFWETCSQNKVVNTRDLEDRRLYWHLECLARPLPKGEVSLFCILGDEQEKSKSEQR